MEAIAHVDLIEQELLDKSRDEVAVHLYIAPDENFAEIGELMRDRLERAEVPYRMEYDGRAARRTGRTGWKAVLPRYGYRHDGWLSCRAGKRTKPDRAVITLDPGMAFGTGTHETTALCLETLDGAGEGRRARAGHRHGQRHSCHCGTEIGRGRSRRRGHRPHVRAHGRRKRGPQRRAERLYGTRWATCPTRPAACIRRHLRQHRGQRHHRTWCRTCPRCWQSRGTFLASGIIDTRKDEVIAAVQAAGLALREVKEKNGWVALVCGHTGRE